MHGCLPSLHRSGSHRRRSWWGPAASGPTDNRAVASAVDAIPFKLGRQRHACVGQSMCGADPPVGQKTGFGGLSHSVYGKLRRGGFARTSTVFECCHPRAEGVSNHPPSRSLPPAQAWSRPSTVRLTASLASGKMIMLGAVCGAGKQQELLDPGKAAGLWP